jgi:hypothetical protein
MQLPDGWGIPKWNDDNHKLLKYGHYLKELEAKLVFFSSPMDLDFAMLKSFPRAYKLNKADLLPPKIGNIRAVLGDNYHGDKQYTVDERKLFITYYKRFKLGGKPAAHIHALSTLTDEKLLANMPPSLARLADAAIAKLAELPE